MRHNNSIQIIFTLLIVLTLSLLATSCTPVKQPEAAEEKTTLNSIVVLPVEGIYKASGQKDMATTEDFPEDFNEGLETVNRLVTEYFTGNNHYRIISADQKDAVTEGFAGSPVVLAREIGRKLSSDAVLLLTLNRFVNRGGTERALTSHPASVSFEYRVIMVKTGVVLCSGAFDETQQDVFSNILDISSAVKRGFKWITAEELAKEGITAKFNDCSYLKWK